MRIFSYHLAPLADALYDRLENDDLRHRGWRFALYRALRSSTGDDNEPIYWKTEYHQWSVDHHYRGSRHGAKSRIADCRIASIDQLTDDRVQIRAVFTDMQGSEQPADCTLGLADFPASLWVAQNANGDTLLEGSFERDRIFDGLLPRPALAATQAASPAPGEPIDLHPKLTALHAMTAALQPFYEQASAEEQAYLETVVGAAVFYLPQSVEHFDGHISLECLRGCLEEERRVKDHIYPRKRAGRHLLTNTFSPNELHDLYHHELARFMYLTPSENSKMVNYYETYDDHDSALYALDIVKFPSNCREPFLHHGEFRNFLRYLARTGVKKLEDVEEANSILDDFRLIG